MSYFATLNGKPVARAHLVAPWTGPWLATLMPHDADVPKGSVQVQIGQLTLNGTVDPDRSGAFAGEARIVVRAGAGAWGKPVTPKQNHNDGTLRRSSMAIDAAKVLGESLVVSASVDGPLVGVDFPREAAAGSRILEQLFPGVVWYVGADGVTRVGPRTTRDVSASVRVLELDTTTKRATLALEGDDVGSLLPGGSISDLVRLGGEPFVIHDVEILLDESELRATAWGRPGRDGVLLGALRQLVREADPRRTFLGLYRYRVYKMSGDRVELQIVNRSTGLPDVLPISIMPGVAGASFDLTSGCVVLVQFVEGDPSLPVVTHLAKKGDSGFLPVMLALDATDTLSLGATAQKVNAGNAEAYALRTGDAVKLTATGSVVVGGSGSVTVTGTIELAPTVVAPGPPPTGRSKVKL
jgi:hypothetical protein